MRTIGKALLITFAIIGILSVLVTAGGIYAVQRFLDHTEETAADQLPETFVLTIDLDAAFPESIQDPFEVAFQPHHRTLAQAVSLIEQAAEDPQVHGLFATLSGNGRALADVQELRQALQVFRDSGKPMVLFSPSLGGGGNGTGATYLASVFPSVWMQPSGSVDMIGFGIEVPFARDALADLGIEADYGRRYEYKTALDSAITQNMSEAFRASTKRMLESFRDQVALGLADRPNVTQQQALTLLQGPPLLAQEAVEAGLVDHLGYRDEAFAAALESAGVVTETLSFGAYQGLALSYDHPSQSIAVIQIDGVIQRQPSDGFGQGAPDSDAIAQAVRDAVAAPDTAAIVLRVNSPGGSYVASDTIWREVVRAREADIPVIVSMGSVAASGGYFVAMPASKIVAQPGTITGSIGVFGVKPVLAGLWEDLNVNWEQVSLSPYATMYSLNQRFTPAQRAAFEKGLDAAYGDFTGKLAQGRNLSTEMIDKVARGRVWTGLDAHAVGLVDALGGLNEAIAIAQEEAGFDRTAKMRLRPYPEPQSPFEAILESFDLGQFAQAAQALATLNTLASPLIQASEEARVSAQGPALLAPQGHR